MLSQASTGVSGGIPSSLSDIPYMCRKNRDHFIYKQNDNSSLSTAATTLHNKLATSTKNVIIGRKRYGIWITTNTAYEN